MAPTITREYRIPTDIDKTGNTNVAPQLQAILSDPSKVDGARVIFPSDANYRADAGLSFKGRHDFIADFEGAKITTPVDVIYGRAFTDCVVTNPTNPAATTGTAVYTAAGSFPNFSNQLWWALGPGVPGDTRVGYDDAHHVHLTKPVACGSGKTITFVSALDRARSHISLVDCDHFDVNNPIVIGSNEQGGQGDAAYVPQLEAQHAINMAGCVDGKIVDAECSYMYGDGIATSRSPTTGRLNSFIEVVSPYIHHTGRIGITPKGITDSTFKDAVCKEIRRSVIDIEPTDPKDTCRRVTFVGGTFSGYRLGWLAGSAYNNVAADVGDIVLAGIQLAGIGCSVTPGTTKRWGPFIFWLLTARTPSGNPSGYALGFTRCDGVIVRDCVFKLQAGRNMRGVKTTACTGVNIGGNNYADGIGEFTSFP